MLFFCFKDRSKKVTAFKAKPLIDSVFEFSFQVNSVHSWRDFEVTPSHFEGGGGGGGGQGGGHPQ